MTPGGSNPVRRDGLCGLRRGAGLQIGLAGEAAAAHYGAARPARCGGATRDVGASGWVRRGDIGTASLESCIDPFRISRFVSGPLVASV